MILNYFENNSEWLLGEWSDLNENNPDSGSTDHRSEKILPSNSGDNNFLKADRNVTENKQTRLLK